MKLRTKLVGSFFAVATLILLIGIVGIFASRQILNAFDAIIEVTTPSLNALARAEADAYNMHETSVHHVLQRRLLAESVEADEFWAAADELRVVLRQYQTIDDEQDLYIRLAEAETAYVNAGGTLILLADLGVTPTELVAQLEVLDEAAGRFNEALQEAISKEEEDFEEELATAQQTAQSATTVYLASMVLVVGAAVTLSVLLSSSILRPIRQLQNATYRMVHGDYTQRTSVTTSDEIGELSTAFNTMAETIQKRDAELISANQTLERRVEDRTKELRVATREAQEASRLKDEFLSIMSHELRTPLNAIIGFQGILLMSGQLEERGKHMIQRSQANANRLLALINDILDVSRIESGRFQLVKTEISPVALVERLQAQTSVLADEKKLDFNVWVDPEIPPIILADEDALTKIITNLLGNAFKFTDKGSVSLLLRQRADQLVIEVSDTGVGIPSHMHQIIFERFRQVDGSSKRAHGGSGLGLSIVQKLCAALNGTVQVESLVGQGSTFTVVVPLEAVRETFAL